VFEEALTTADLLEKWRDATRAAELAKRLAQMALEAAEQADRSAIASEELAKMAERAADAASEAAMTARRAADVAAAHASSTRSTRLENANDVVEATEADEEAARDAYHRAEKEARDRLERS
jgi:hypothetical protein